MVADNGEGAEEVVVNRTEYQITTVVSGSYRVVRVRGRYADDLLDDLRTKVFPENTSFALDASGLTGFATPFAREIVHTAQLLKGVDHRLVLLRPPDRLRSLVSLVAPDTPLAVFMTEAQLTDDPRETDSRTIHAAHEMVRILKELQTNKLWQYTDREGCWICPFCAKLQNEIILPQDAIATPLVEKVYRHLWYQCAPHSMVDPQTRPRAELEQARKRANQDKVVVTKRRMTAIESKMTYLEDQAKKAEALEQSVKIASERQKRLLPAKPPEIEGAEIGIVYRPAEQVSGDFFDFVPLQEGRMGFLIGDVAGHGIEAGILMGMAKKMLSVRLEEHGDPAAAICHANDDLFRELDRQSFVTAYVAVYDPAKRTLVGARAGHNPPILFHPERKPAVTEFDAGGIGIGLTRGNNFDQALKSQTTALKSGDVFLLYTDGLVEAKNPAGEEFGTRRIAMALESTVGSAPPFILIDLSDSLDRFGHGIRHEDDVTAVCVRFR